MDFNQKIAGTNVTYNDLIRSDTAIRNGITNIPNDEQIKNLEALAKNVLYKVTLYYSIVISSGFRCTELNEKIGSSSTSNHLLGEAADIEIAGSDKNTPLILLLKFIYDHCEFHELIAEFFPVGWVHVAYREGQNDKILKLKDATHNYSIITIDELLKLY
jgi:zinc D-Ala-D-Ala carboxypeptidase